MKYNFKSYIFLLLLVILTLLSCKSDGDYVSKHYWKYYDGACISDWLEFDNDYNVIRNDTIFIGDTAKAVINKVEKRLFGGNILVIKDIISQEEGLYCKKD